MTSIRLLAPHVEANAVTIRWIIEPPPGLYVRDMFTLRFPAGVDCTAIPERLWWTVALLCLHAQWLLLRPCRVELPVRLLPGEAELWLRLTDAGVSTLEAMRGTSDVARTIQIVEGDLELPLPQPLPEIGRCATAFSGGKDSLLQAALLAELSFRPLLVATTSPMAPFHDHVTERRRHVFREIAARRDVRLVEVESDLRSAWDNNFAANRRNYSMSVSELSDAHLYLASLLVSGFAGGATHLFMASEAEVQVNAECDGRTVQHPHFMYSVVTLRAVSALLAPYGMRCSSLTSPLHTDSVQRLLWTRYSDLADLQYSCWNVPLDGAACSRCRQCLKIALSALAAHGDPGRMGVDLASVLVAQRDWTPSAIEPAASALPHARARYDNHRQIAGNAARLGRTRVLAALVRGDVRRLANRGTWRALAAFDAVKRRARKRPTATTGWLVAALADVDPLLREGVGTIYARAFSPEPPAEHEAMLRRADVLATWIAAPMTRAALPGNGAAPGTGVEPAGVPPVLAATELEPSDAFVLDLLPAYDPILSTGAGPIIPVSAPLLDGNELRYVTECVRSGWISSGGEFVRRFEDAFAAAVGCAHGVACSNGTAALHLALATLGLSAGDEVIVPTFTMIATPNAVAYTGATPVLVDADPVHWNLDPDAVEAAVTPRTRAIVVVHTYGAPAQMDAIRAIAARHRLAVVEDAAEAHGAAYRGRPVGALGDAATFSFYANKIITTGEGGMLTTNDARIAAVARRLRDHAFSDDYHFWHRYRGFNYRMTSLQAAVGLAQTERFAELVAMRRALAAAYSDGLRDVDGLTLPVEQAGTTNVFWMYALLVDPAFGRTRDELRSLLAQAGIETRTTFIPVHLQPIYRAAQRGRSYPVAESLCARGLYLPTSAALRDTDVARVVAAVRAARKPARA
jgi:perosamine synthetase